MEQPSEQLLAHDAGLNALTTMTATTTTTYNQEGVPTTDTTVQVTGGLPNGIQTEYPVPSTSAMVADASALVAQPPHSAPAFLPELDPGSYRRTGIVYDERMMLHSSLDYMRDTNEMQDIGWEHPRGFEYDYKHPEVPLRISRIFDLLKANFLLERMIDVECQEVEREDALLVHTEEMWDSLQATSAMTIEEIKATWERFEHDSLFVNSSTALASRLSCGGVIAACEAVMTGRQGIRNAFAVVRPPGHHAEPDHAMGFCFLNNVAVAVNSVRRRLGVGKVMILDWDVHHGNGTQRAFLEDPNVLYVSLHRHEGGRFYPCSDFGAIDVTGRGAGEGTSVNIPWPTAGFGDADYIYAFQRIIMPIAYEFAPELVIISAGFDAALGDELGMCKVTPAGYAHMTHMLMSLAGGKLVVALEGGYNLEATSTSALAVARVLLGEGLPELPPMQASMMATEVMYQVAKVQSRYWKCIDVKACEPLDEGSDDEEADMIVHIPDILKAYRSKHLREKFQLILMPIAEPDLATLFPQQVFTDENVYNAETIVLFAHDFGNLQVENTSPLFSDCELEKSYLIDCSDKVVRWTRSRGYSLLDVNMMKALPTHRSQLSAVPQLYVQKNAPKSYVMLMRYLWDNIIEVSAAKNVILLGFGTGCQAVMSLLNDRDVEERVKAVIQVGGLQSFVRPDPDQDEKRAWFRKRSKLFIPVFHPIMDNEKMKKRLATQIVTLPHKRVAKILSNAFPDIESFVDGLVEPKNEANGDSANQTMAAGLLANGAGAATNGTSSSNGASLYDNGVVPMDLS